MKLTLIALISLLVINLVGFEPKFMKDPAISPDGEMVCFSYMTDLWLVPYRGGEAKRITVSEGSDFSPKYSPDGKWISFSSNRDGFNGVYVIPSDGGQARLLTRDVHSVSDWYADSQRLLGIRYKYRTGTGLYTIYLDGRRPSEVTPVGHYFSALSPDNTKVIYNQRGIAHRPSYTGSMKGDLWEYDTVSNTHRRLTDTELSERYPVYSHQNPYIYYGASDGRIFQLFRVTDYDFENREQLTFFEDWTLRDISIARDNDRIVFERFDEIWSYDPVSNSAQKIEVNIKQDFLGSFDVFENHTDRGQNISVSPDGKLIAFSYKFDLFAFPEKGGEVKQLTFDNKGIGEIVILPDNKTIYFLKRDKGYFQLFYLDITEPDNVVKNLWSEDKYITHIYQLDTHRLAINYEVGEDRWKLALLDTRTGRIDEVMEEFDVWARFIALTPDGRQAFYTTGRREVWTRHLYLYDFATQKSTLLLNNNGYIGNLFVGNDNKSLFLSWGSELARLDLVPRSDFYGETDNWDEILNPDAETKQETISSDEFKIVYEGLQDRLSIISSRAGFNSVAYVIDDSTMYYLNSNGNQRSLRKIDYMGKNDEEIVGFKGRIDSWLYNETNNCFYATVDDKIMKINPSSKRAEVIPNNFEYEYNEISLNKTVFDELWVEFGRAFYDYQLHGHDWTEMYYRYRPYLKHSYNAEYFGAVVDEMIGELNASHTGFYPRSRETVGRNEAKVGIVFDYSKSPDKGVYLRDVYRHSSLAQVYGIRAGDKLLSVDGIEINPDRSLDSLFINKTDKKIVMEFETADGKKTAEVKGFNFSNHYDLYYRDWVDTRRDKVTDLSNGRLGYIHIQRMNNESLEKFKKDLFAENYDKEGLVIDVRFNGGGNISRHLLDILTREHRAYTTTRGYPDEMLRTPNEIWDKPLTLLINESSFSDAEIFPILFQQAGLGKVIGIPTSGGVIGTTPYELMDGSSMRLPRSGWFTLDGVNMEGTGANPDILVDLTPEQLINDEDVQLKKAVEVLLEELDN